MEIVSVVIPVITLLIGYMLSSQTRRKDIDYEKRKNINLAVYNLLNIRSEVQNILLLLINAFRFNDAPEEIEKERQRSYEKFAFKNIITEQIASIAVVDPLLGSKISNAIHLTNKYKEIKLDETGKVRDFYYRHLLTLESSFMLIIKQIDNSLIELKMKYKLEYDETELINKEKNVDSIVNYFPEDVVGRLMKEYGDKGE